jgi:hypothetical protein
MAIFWLKGLGKLKKFNDLIGNKTLDLPACSIVPQPTMLPRAPRIRIRCHNSKTPGRNIHRSLRARQQRHYDVWGSEPNIPHLHSLPNGWRILELVPNIHILSFNTPLSSVQTTVNRSAQKTLQLLHLV